MPELDPDPTNELGKGIFPPDKEAEMLAEGVVYARYIDFEGNRIILASFRPFKEAVNRMFILALEIILRHEVWRIQEEIRKSRETPE
ncbi:MAG: hypothetical protein M9936_24690 [Caldilinea sp.]|nr:hypothetical protein [Caldilineaceae bacterium]MCO5212911.1 hypothetical protein [Caldilinea sp.]MCW5843943.1 hypothetical protein [Caldilinea sp.]